MKTRITAGFSLIVNCPDRHILTGSGRDRCIAARVEVVNQSDQSILASAYACDR